MINSRLRFLIIRLCIVAMLFLLLFKLFDMQVVNGDKYDEVSRNRLNVNMIEKAPRGQIYDRYGTPLVSNRAGYSLQLFKSDMENDDFNEMLLKLINILSETGEYNGDNFPVSNYPFEFSFADDEEKSNWFSKTKSPKSLKHSMSAEEVVFEFSKFYDISDEYSPEDIRKIIGIRYDASVAGFSTLSPYTLAEDIGVDLVSLIKERSEEFPGIAVTSTYFRDYQNSTYASHILGRIGKMNEKEYEQYKEKGYSYNEVVGKQGVEKWAEDYLHGTDGTSGIDKNVNGKSVTLIKKNPAIKGDNVILTIDMNMQKVLEDSLASNIENISSSGGKTTGEDANAGAAAVIDVKTGDVLACASYPTYNLSTFNEDYSSLVENTAKPLWNRAVSGTYTPGSTFKPLVAIAALQTGTITTDEIIEDKGIYRFYEDYQPKCWIYKNGKGTHGKVNVSSAIEKSCNYFFYETGRRTGIDVIDNYAAQFGLGEFTGIELPEEVKGSVAGPEYKKKVVKKASEKNWFGADTLQAAIGQSYHAITPIQLANYAATIANDGVRHKVNLIKSIRSSVDNSVVKEFEPQVLNTVEISDENMKAVKEGMKNVVDEGSAHAIFKGYPIEIGGKTGTAQIGKNVSNNAFFIAFAPYENPEIAICVAMEHGVTGSNAAYVARDLFDYYFNLAQNNE